MHLLEVAVARDADAMPRTAFIHLWMVFLFFASNASAATHHVSIFPNSFSPATLQINVGDTVTWTNEDEEDFHTVTSSTGAWPQMFFIDYGDQASVIFSQAGTFNYFDQFGIATGTITVSAGTGNQAPSVSISSPTNSAHFIAPATFNINASASDPDGTVTNVAFFVGTQFIANDASAPFTCTVSNLAAGTYQLFAVASDNLGLSSGNTQDVTIVVSGPSSLTSPRIQNGNFVFTITNAVPGHLYTVEASTNLSLVNNWSILDLLVAETNYLHYTNSGVVGTPQRFYRVKTN